MYNEKRKKEYLAYKGQEYLKHVFIDSQSYEAELQKDLCDMDTSEIIHYLLQYDGYRMFEEKRRQISNYIEWCVIKGYTPMNWIAPKVVSGKALKEIYLSAKEDFYISKEMFETFLKRLQKCGYGAYIASVFWCVYEGIAGKAFYNLANMRLRDIDRECCQIHLADGRTRKVPEALIQMLYETAEIERVTNDKTVRYVSALYPDSVWKIRKNDKVTVSKVQRKFIYLMEEMKKILNDDRISRTAIERSGYFNKIYSRALEDGIDIRRVDMGSDKAGREENKSYQKYFEDSGENMNMRKFKFSYQSYLNQL